MYYYLVQALKRRLILELQDSFSGHPIYEKIVPFIQNKYSFKERPQFGIVVKGASANKVSLSADNFTGVVQSHVMLAYVGQPTHPLEWVREDLACVRAHGDRMPIAPGVYYMEILTVPETVQGTGTFVIDPLLTVTNEPVLFFETGIEQEAQLQQVPAPKTLRLWENSRFLLQEGTHYRLDENGRIEFMTQFTPNSTLTADYRYPVASMGPISFSWNKADFKTLPGVVLAFGKRAKVGDKVAIVVYGDRVETAHAYSGRFDVTFELDVISQDPHQMEEIADLALMYLYGIKRPHLSTEGIEITDVSIGGESEETYDETADLMFYNASLTVQIQADWEIHIPLPLTISKVTPTTPQQDLASDPNARGLTSTIIGDVRSRLLFATNPIIEGRNSFFERIT